MLELCRDLQQGIYKLVLVLAYTHLPDPSKEQNLKWRHELLIFNRISSQSVLIPLSFISVNSPPSPAFLYAFCTFLLQKDLSFVLFDAQTVSLGATAEDCQVDEKPQTLGEKPSLSLCPCSPSSASHINTDITPMAILSALLGGLLHCKLWKCVCSLLNSPDYLSTPHYGSRWKKNGVSLLTLMALGHSILVL